MEALYQKVGLQTGASWCRSVGSPSIQQRLEAVRTDINFKAIVINQAHLILKSGLTLTDESTGWRRANWERLLKSIPKFFVELLGSGWTYGWALADCEIVVDTGLHKRVEQILPLSMRYAHVMDWADRKTMYYGQDLDLERCLVFEVLSDGGKPLPFGMQLYEPISRLQDLYETEAQAAIQDGLGSVYAVRSPVITGSVTSDEVVQQFLNKLDKNLSTKGILNGWEIKPVADRRRSPDFYASAIQHNLALLYTAFCMEWKSMGESSVGVYGSYMASLDSYKSNLETIKERLVDSINSLIAREAAWNNEPQTAFVQAGPITFEDKPEEKDIQTEKTQSLTDWLQDKGESVKKAFFKELENRRAGGTRRPFKVTEATYATKILGYDEQIVRANWASVQEKLRRLLDDDGGDDYTLQADFDSIWSEFAVKVKERR